MTELKLVGKPTAAAAKAFNPHIQTWYDRQGCYALAVVELHHVGRYDAGGDSDKKPSVDMKITSAEVPIDPDTDRMLRDIMRALYVVRTASGTLDEANEVFLSKQTVKDAAGNMQLTLMAKLSAGTNHWLQYLRRVQANAKLTQMELRHELDTVIDGLAALLGGRDSVPDDPDE